MYREKIGIEARRATLVANLRKENLYIDYIKLCGSERPFSCILKFVNAGIEREFIFFEDGVNTGKLKSGQSIRLSGFDTCTAHFPLSGDDCHDGAVTLVLRSRVAW